MLGQSFIRIGRVHKPANETSASFHFANDGNNCEYLLLMKRVSVKMVSDVVLPLHYFHNIVHRQVTFRCCAMALFVLVFLHVSFCQLYHFHCSLFVAGAAVVAVAGASSMPVRFCIQRR